MTPPTAAVVDDRDDQHAVVEEDLGDLGVGEVGADVDVLGVHVLADGLDAAASRFSSVSSSERRRKPGALELVEVAREQRRHELALAEDAGVALALVDDGQRGQLAVEHGAHRVARSCRRACSSGGLAQDELGDRARAHAYLSIT